MSDRGSQSRGTRGLGGALRHDLGADALVGKALQENRVLHASVDQMDLSDTGLDGFAGAVEFRNHSTGNHAVGNKLIDFVAADGRDKGFGVLGITEHAWDVGKEDELADFHLAGDFARRHVRIDIIDTAVLVAGQRCDHGNFTACDNPLQLRGIYIHDLADEAQVLGLVRLGVGGADLLASQDILAGDCGGGCVAGVVQVINEMRIYDVVEDAVHDLDRVGVRVAQPVDEFGLDVGFLQLGIDGLATAVDDDGIHPRDLHERHVPQNIVGAVEVLHCAATELHQHGRAVELLKIRQGFNQDLCLVLLFLDVQHRCAVC